MTPITSNADLQAFCGRLASAPFIAVDTEFMRETTYWPILCLIQVASLEDAAVIDPMAEGLDLTPLLALLADPKIVKVFHAARQDVEIFNNLGVIPNPLFDTQIAAMAAGFGEQVAYDALVRQMLKVDLDKSSRFTDWGRRPLPVTSADDACGPESFPADGPPGKNQTGSLRRRASFRLPQFFPNRIPLQDDLFSGHWWPLFPNSFPLLALYN